MSKSCDSELLELYSRRTRGPVLKNKLFFRMIKALLIVNVGLSASGASAQQWYGGEEDVAFAEKLWVALLEAGMVGDNSKAVAPYTGMHPHGTVLETLWNAVTVDGREALVVVKRSYRGGASLETVLQRRSEYLFDITIMYKREDGYDEENQNWYWAKYNPDGTLDATPNGVQLAGRIAKNRSKGCIACHKKAGGDDYLFVN